MKTLLIWDQFGEADLAAYVIEDAPGWLEKCHQKFINTIEAEDVAELLTRVNDALCENPDYYCNKDDELAGAWVDKKVNLNKPAVLDMNGPFSVVVSGFVP
jgi:hypothetical protein